MSFRPVVAAAACMVRMPAWIAWHGPFFIVQNGAAAAQRQWADPGVALLSCRAMSRVGHTFRSVKRNSTARHATCQGDAHAQHPGGGEGGAQRGVQHIQEHAENGTPDRDTGRATTLQERGRGAQRQRLGHQSRLW